jgi:hypothetical protein
MVTPIAYLRTASGDLTALFKAGEELGALDKVASITPTDTRITEA